MLTGLLINNTRHSGNFLAFPDASVDDAGFDVMELNAGLIKQNLYNLSVLTKKFFLMPPTINKIQSMSIQFKNHESLMIDG